MDATYFRPKLRWPIDIQLQQGVEAEEQVLVVRCPLGVSPKPLALVAAVAPVLSLFQGELSFDEILARCAPYGLQDQPLLGLRTRNHANSSQNLLKTFSFRFRWNTTKANYTAS